MEIKTEYDGLLMVTLLNDGTLSTLYLNYFRYTNEYNKTNDLELTEENERYIDDLYDICSGYYQSLVNYVNGAIRFCTDVKTKEYLELLKKDILARF